MKETYKPTPQRIIGINNSGGVAHEATLFASRLNRLIIVNKEDFVFPSVVQIYIYPCSWKQS